MKLIQKLSFHFYRRNKRDNYSKILKPQSSPRENTATMRRLYLLLKRRRELKKDGKKKKREETVARSREHLSEIDTRAHTDNDVLLTQKKGCPLRLQIARTKRREAELIRTTLTNSLNDFVENMYTRDIIEICLELS